MLSLLDASVKLPAATLIVTAPLEEEVNVAVYTMLDVAVNELRVPLTMEISPGTYTYKFRNGFCDNWDNCGAFWEDILDDCGVGEWGGKGW